LDLPEGHFAMKLLFCHRLRPVLRTSLRASDRLPSASAGAFMALSLIGICLVVAGCGTRAVPVEGMVSFGGIAVAEGTIIFEQMEQGKPSAIASEIQAGAYRAVAPPGTYRVVFSAYRTADTLGPDGQPHKIQYLPAKFTADSEMTVEVTPGGDTKLDFDLR